MSGNGKFWTGLAFGALTGVAVGASAYAASRGCYGHYSYTPYYTGFGFGSFLNSCFFGHGIGYGRTGWGPNSVIYGPDAFTALYAPPTVLANANLGYFIA